MGADCKEIKKILVKTENCESFVTAHTFCSSRVSESKMKVGDNHAFSEIIQPKFGKKWRLRKFLTDDWWS